MTPLLRETCAELGKRRLETADKAAAQKDWSIWYPPVNPYLFKWGECWKGNVKYSVTDFEAEAGFWLDILGLDSLVLSSDFCMVMTPDKVFTFSFAPAGADAVTPANAISIEFMLSGIKETALELEKRGIVFDVPIREDGEGSTLFTGSLRTPHGIAVTLWGLEQA